MGKGRWEWTLIEIEMFTPAVNETSADALMISNCPFSIARKHFQHPPKRSFIHWWGGKRWSFPFSFHRLPVLPAWPNIKEDLRTPWVSWLWANIMSLLSRGWGESLFTLSLEGFLGHCRYLTGLSAFSVYIVCVRYRCGGGRGEFETESTWAAGTQRHSNLRAGAEFKSAETEKMETNLRKLFSSSQHFTVSEKNSGQFFLAFSF